MGSDSRNAVGAAKLRAGAAKAATTPASASRPGFDRGGMGVSLKRCGIGCQIFTSLRLPMKL